MTWRRVVAAVVVVGLLAAAGGLAWAAFRADDVTVPSTPEEIDYVALGDSYTAGPLIPVVREDAPGCFRSTNNYPAYLAGLLDVVSYRDASCSGASSDDVAGRQSLLFDNRARPQLAALSAGTDLVTIGLGGNDFGLFGSVSGGCGGSWKSVATPCQDRFGDTKARDARRVRRTLRDRAGGRHRAGAGRRGVRRRLSAPAARVGDLPGRRLHRRRRRLGARHRDPAQPVGPPGGRGRRGDVRRPLPGLARPRHLCGRRSLGQRPAHGPAVPPRRSTPSWWGCARRPGRSTRR